MIRVLVTRPDAETNRRQLHAQSILLVDDSMLQLRAWARDLEADGRRVHLAENGEQALAAAAAEPLDLAIVDMRLGSEDGLALVPRLKAIKPELVVVVVSGDMSVAHAMAAVRAGADDVLVKPFIPREVVRQLEHGVTAEPPEATSLTLEEVEWEHISRALLETNQNITQAAERLGIYRQTLQRKLRKRDREREDP